MSTATYARVRSALVVNPLLRVFIAIYVSIVALSFAAFWTLEWRLPAVARHDAWMWLMFELAAITMCLVRIGLPRQNRMRHALEEVLPFGLYVLGGLAGGLTASLWLGLEPTESWIPLGAAHGLGLVAFGLLTGMLLGRYLAGLAVSGRLRREAASSRRSAWFAETSADGSGRRATGITLGLFTLPMMLLAQVKEPADVISPLAFQVLLAGWWALAVVVGKHATISITDAGVKVRTGWSVSLSEIESAQAIAARPEPLNFDRSRCVLRTGPALVIKTVTGGRYTVSLDEAAEAVAVIEALRSGA